MAHEELYDIGENRRDSAEPISAPGSKIDYPSNTINDTLLPFLKADVGTEIPFEGILHITGSREPGDFDTIQKGNYVSFEIRKMGAQGSINKTKGEPSKEAS